MHPELFLFTCRLPPQQHPPQQHPSQQPAPTRKDAQTMYEAYIKDHMSKMKIQSSELKDRLHPES